MDAMTPISVVSKQQGCQDGLSEEQRKCVIEKAHILLNNFRANQTYDIGKK